MYSIGIRVAVQKKKPLGKIYYAVTKLDGEGFDIVKVSYINIPVAVEVPEKLAFIRTIFMAIIMEYNIQLAGLRITETIAKDPLVYRMNIEGVIQELFANSTIEKYQLLNITRLSSILEEKKEVIKLQLKNGEPFADIDNWDKYKLEERECLMTSVAMLQLEVE